VARRPFNDPFGKLATQAPRPAKVVPPPRPPRPAEAPPASEEELWALATAGVRQLDPGPGSADPRRPAAGPQQIQHPDLEALDELRALVSGDGPFDIADSDEFIEGRAPGVDRSIVRKLRRGEFAVQGHKDLHGMTREEAKAAVDRFLRESRNQGKRCVLLVHGRGLHSKDQMPVLKEALRTWLVTSRFDRHVLAFATARPVDGGAGAVYVLLRRAGR